MQLLKILYLSVYFQSACFGILQLYHLMVKLKKLPGQHSNAKWKVHGTTNNPFWAVELQDELKAAETITLKALRI